MANTEADAALVQDQGGESRGKVAAFGWEAFQLVAVGFER